MVVTIVPVPATQEVAGPKSADPHLYSRQAQHSNTLLCWSHSNIKLFATMLTQSWQIFVLLRQNLHFPYDILETLTVLRNVSSELGAPFLIRVLGVALQWRWPGSVWWAHPFWRQNPAPVTLCFLSRSLSRPNAAPQRPAWCFPRAADLMSVGHDSIHIEDGY